MTRFMILVLTLLLATSEVYAEWVEVGRTDGGEMTAYADSGTIRRKGDLVKMWSLLDYKTVQTGIGVLYLSTNQQNEYDCAEERTRILAFTWFSGNMGKGAAVYSGFSPENKWEPVSPGSVNKAMWKSACGKK